MDSRNGQVLGKQLSNKPSTCDYMRGVGLDGWLKPFAMKTPSLWNVQEQTPQCHGKYQQNYVQKGREWIRVLTQCKWGDKWMLPHWKLGCKFPKDVMVATWPRTSLQEKWRWEVTWNLDACAQSSVLHSGSKTETTQICGRRHGREWEWIPVGTRGLLEV